MEVLEIIQSGILQFGYCLGYAETVIYVQPEASSICKLKED